MIELTEHELFDAEGSYGIARPAADWPQPKPEATAASAADIRAGLRVQSVVRSAAFAHQLAALEHRIPGQVIAGDAAGDPAELRALREAGFAAMLMLPVVCGGRELAVLEVYRSLPQAFTGAEVDRARVVAQQFGAALDRLSA